VPLLFRKLLEAWRWVIRTGGRRFASQLYWCALREMKSPIGMLTSTMVMSSR
jgi:hypothetical protein